MDASTTMSKKYEFTGETKEYDGRTLHRIRALRDIEVPYDEADETGRCDRFEVIKAGEIGGWIESEANLRQDDRAWVADEAIVMEKACVSGFAIVFDQAVVGGTSVVTDCAAVYGRVRFLGEVLACNQARINGDVVVDRRCKVEFRDYVLISGGVKFSASSTSEVGATISGHAIIAGTNITIIGGAEIGEYAELASDVRIVSGGIGGVYIRGHARLSGNIAIYQEGYDSANSVCIEGSAIVEGSVNIVIHNGVTLKGCAYIDGDVVLRNCRLDGRASITESRHYLSIGPVRGRSVTFYREQTYAGGRPFIGFTIDNSALHLPTDDASLTELLGCYFGDAEALISFITGIAPAVRAYFAETPETD